MSIKETGTLADRLQLEVYYLLLHHSGLVESRKDMAGKMGYSYVYLTNLFSGKYPLTPKAIAAMAEAFPVPFHNGLQDAAVSILAGRIQEISRTTTRPA
jgi:transcriptional regulator with XRE-family HTH domain